MASYTTPRASNPGQMPFSVPFEKYGETDGQMTHVTDTWFKIVKCDKSQYTTEAPFAKMADLAEKCWNWLTKSSEYTLKCYTGPVTGGHCIVSCLFAPNENGGCFFLATIPRGLVRADMLEYGRTMAPIWYAAAETNGVIGSGEGGNIHAEDAAEWLFEISDFWNRKPAAVGGGYLPAGAGQPEVRLLSWGKGRRDKEATLINPCPLDPFQGTRKMPPCERVARFLNIHIWRVQRRPTVADRAMLDKQGGGSGTGQGGPGVGGSGANPGRGAQGGAGNTGAGSSSTPGAGGPPTGGPGGNQSNTDQVDDLAAHLARAKIGDRPSSSSSSKSNASSRSVASSSNSISRKSDASGSTNSSTPSLGKPGTKSSTQKTPKSTTTASSTKTTAVSKPKDATVKAPAVKATESKGAGKK